MKNLRRVALSFFTLAIAGVVLCAAAPNEKVNQNKDAFDPPKQLKIAVVDFKECVEKSKLGKQEQGNFDALKKQMETILEEKEKALNDIASKFNDIDYLDSLSPEAEADLKRKFRALNQELTQQQSQYYQALNQANIKIIQRITDTISAASKEVAKKYKIDLVLNEDSAFFKTGSLDISPFVVVVMDEMYEKEAKDKDKNKSGSNAGLFE